MFLLQKLSYILSSMCTVDKHHRVTFVL